jgi:hypothetical protein
MNICHADAQPKHPNDAKLPQIDSAKAASQIER